MDHTYRQSSKRGGTPWRRWPKMWCLSPRFLQRWEGKNKAKDRENENITEDVIIHLEAPCATSIINLFSHSFVIAICSVQRPLFAVLSAVGSSHRPWVAAIPSRCSLLPNSSAEKCCVQKDWPLVSFISYSSCRPSPWECGENTSIRQAAMGDFKEWEHSEATSNKLSIC